MILEKKDKRGDLYETIATYILEKLFQKGSLNVNDVSNSEVIIYLNNIGLNKKHSNENLMTMISNNKTGIGLVLKKLKHNKNYRAFKEFKTSGTDLGLLIDKIKKIPGTTSHKFSTGDFYIMSNEFVTFLHSDEFKHIKTKDELFIACNGFWMTKDFIPVSWKSGGLKTAKIELHFQPNKKNFELFKSIVYPKNTTPIKMEKIGRFSTRWITILLNNGWSIGNNFHCEAGNRHKALQNTLTFSMSKSGGFADGSDNQNDAVNSMISGIIKKYNIDLYSHSTKVQKHFKGMKILPDNISKKLFEDIKNKTTYLKGLTKQEISTKPNDCGHIVNPLYMNYEDFSTLSDNTMLNDFALRNSLVAMGWLRVFTNQEFIEKYVPLKNPRTAHSGDQQTSRTVATYVVVVPA